MIVGGAVGETLEEDGVALLVLVVLVVSSLFAPEDIRLGNVLAQD